MYEYWDKYLPFLQQKEIKLVFEIVTSNFYLSSNFQSNLHKS